MSVPDRRALLDPSAALRVGHGHGDLSIRRQCRLLGLARSGVYRPRRAANDNDLDLMRRIDELFTQFPFLGSRRLALMLGEQGLPINRKRMQRLMRRMATTKCAVYEPPVASLPYLVVVFFPDGTL
jgi:putative transposase